MWYQKDPWELSWGHQGPVNPQRTIQLFECNKLIIARQTRIYRIAFTVDDLLYCGFYLGVTYRTGSPSNGWIYFSPNDCELLTLTEIQKKSGHTWNNSQPDFDVFSSNNFSENVSIINFNFRRWSSIELNRGRNITDVFHKPFYCMNNVQQNVEVISYAVWIIRSICFQCTFKIFPNVRFNLMFFRFVFELVKFLFFSDEMMKLCIVFIILKIINFFRVKNRKMLSERECGLIFLGIHGA